MITRVSAGDIFANFTIKAHEISHPTYVYPCTITLSFHTSHQIIHSPPLQFSEPCQQLPDHATLQLTTPLTKDGESYRVSMARLYVLEGGADGPILDCAAVDLASFATNVKKEEIDMQMGCRLIISVETIWREEPDKGLQNLMKRRGYSQEIRLVHEGGIWRENPFVAEIDTPSKGRLSFWSIQGPDEFEFEEDEFVDMGNGILAPRRNIAQLRAMAIQDLKGDKPGPFAEQGKVSLLQKSVISAIGPSERRVIELGTPISLSRSSVVMVTDLLANDVQYVEEPILSDFEEDDIIDCLERNYTYVEGEEGMGNSSSDETEEESGSDYSDNGSSSSSRDTEDKKSSTTASQASTDESEEKEHSPVEEKSTDNIFEDDQGMYKTDARQLEIEVAHPEGEICMCIKDELEELRDKLDKETRRADAAEKENERLLNVILKLTIELEAGISGCDKQKGEIIKQVKQEKGDGGRRRKGFFGRGVKPKGQKKIDGVRS